MSDDETEDEMVDVGAMPPAAGETAPTDDKTDLKSQVAYCRAKLKELEKLKRDLVKDEDFIGAKKARDKLHEQEQEIEGLRTKHLEKVPTPIRKRMRMRLDDAKGEIDEQEVSATVREESSVNCGLDEEGAWETASSSCMACLRDSQCSESPFSIPKSIYAKLYDYQRIGVAWMAKLWEQQGGGILADEMGLGKTIQVCALLNGARKSGATHALLLLPVTLIDQWSREAHIWCPGWPVHKYYGTPQQKARALQRVRRPAGGILLTSYNILGQTDCLFEVVIEHEEGPSRRKRRKLDNDGKENKESDDEDVKEIELPPGKLPEIGERHPWDLVVCDEAHRMKNIGTLLGKSLRHLRSKCRFLLTGTPVQNAMQDLWALMDFAHPGLLGNHTTFVKRFSDPIDQGSVRGANPFQAELKRHLSKQLRVLIRPHILRRTKVGTGLVGDAMEIEVQDRLAEMDDIFGNPDGIADSKDDETGDAVVKKLPPKLETIIWLMPTAEQLTVYQKILEKSDVIREASEKTKLGIEVFRAINMLKRLCNHPALILPCPKPGQWAEHLAEATGGAANDEEQLVSNESTDTPSTVPATGEPGTEADDGRAGRSAEMVIRKLPRTAEAVRQQSAKLRCMSSLIPALVQKGHRILVFAHSLKMLDLVQICCLKPAGIKCLRIDGQTHPTSRAEKVRKFQEQPDRFQCLLLTTNVGGVGLNLTSADRVILVDPAWNPAIDAQAVDRAFRIGQEREVRVYRLIMSGLIEDKMFRLQVFKMGITKNVLEAKSAHSYFTAREIRALFEWTDPAEGSTRQLLEQKHGVDADRAVHEAAEDDGGKEYDGWLDQGPAVGLSDLSLVFGSCVKEEEKPVREDVAAAEHVTQAKEKLDAADKVLQEKRNAREAADAQVEKMRRDLDEAIAGIEQAKEQRLKTDETMKELRSKSAQTRKEATHAKQLFEKANRSRLTGDEQRINASQNVSHLEKNTCLAEKAFEEASTSVRSAEETLSKVINECELHIRGEAENSELVRPEKTMKALVRESLKTLRKKLDTMAIHQAEVENATDHLVSVDKDLAEAERSLAGMGGKDKSGEEQVESWSKQRQKAEDALGQVQEQMDEAWEDAEEVVRAFVDSGVAFAESFDAAPSKDLKVLAYHVKSAQQATKVAFRQVNSALIGVRRAREALTKAAAQRRKGQHKSSAAMSSLKLAEHKKAFAECEYSFASSEAESRRAAFEAMEVEMAATEKLKVEADIQEMGSKKQREDLKAGIPLAKEAARLARLAEKEAMVGRQAVQARWSKVERAQLKMEDLCNSAVEKLKSEEYNPNQHEIAYEGVKRGNSSKILHLPDCKEAVAAAAKTYEEACNVARSAEARLSEAFKSCQLQLAIVDEEGHASAESVVDSPVDKLRDVTAAVEKLQISLDTMAIRQAELEYADEDLIETYSRLTEAGISRARCSNGDSASEKSRRREAERNWKTCEKMNQHALSLQAKALAAAEAAWEEMSQGVQGSLEAGIAFGEALQPSEAKNPLMGQVRTAQHTAHRSFRQVSSAAIAVRRAREGWVKGAAQRRKAVQKESAAIIAHAEVGGSVEAGPTN